MNQDQVDIKTPEYVSLQFSLAGVGSRAAAFIIDQLLLGAAYAIILIIFFLVSKGMASISIFNVDQSLPSAILIIAFFIIYWGYFFAFEFFSGGRTIGKKAMGIRVIQENGHSITLLSSFIRNFLRIIDSLPTSYLLGFFMVFFHPKHKRLGDLVAGTIIVHERKATRKSKSSAIEKEISKRGLHKNDLNLDDWTIKSFKEKDWKLLSTYCSRMEFLTKQEKSKITEGIAGLLLPKMGLNPAEKNEHDLDNILLVLYLNLKEEWEFEL